MIDLSTAQARRVAIAAQGLDRARPVTVNLGTIDRAIQRLGVLQIDSVNVLQRAHYLPLYSRIGTYAPDLLDRATGRAPRRAVEYWAHVAAFIPVELWPVFTFRMERYRNDGHPWWGGGHTQADDILARVRDLGPRTARELDDGQRRSKENWGWNWSEAKRALEYLFLAGELAVAGRTSQFERIYDLPERVLPSTVLNQAAWSAADAHLELVRRAARALGIASANCLADYYRLRVADAKKAIEVMVESGELLPARVEGWGRPTYLHAEARLPRKTSARALLAPFDPLIWERDRTESIFGFRYRIGIYTPAPKREHGYYVLPFLLGDRLVARVDLKADRSASTLRVLASFAEPDAPADTVIELAAELSSMARWLGLDRVHAEPRGDLGPALATELASGS
ncbi:MAG: winged helix-turn-helix domain-containing protein [Marmoricola sp.]